MIRKLQLAALLVIAGVVPVTASAQTTTTTATTTTNSTTTTTTSSFDALSPGNQKIARALFEAQQPTATGGAPLDLNEIADLKGKTGWGNVFKEMKSEGLIGAKNLGQVVSSHEYDLSHSATLGAGNSGGTLTVTTAGGQTAATGPGHSNGAESAEHGSTNAGHHGNETVSNASGASFASAAAVSSASNGFHAGGNSGAHGH